MDAARRELIVARLCAGSVRVTGPAGRGYLVKRPTREQQYAAALLYDDVYRRSQLEGLFSDEEILDQLVRNELWDESREKLYSELPKQIEELKVRMYQAAFKASERSALAKYLGRAKDEFERLGRERGALGHLSCSGTAAVAKARYLVGVGLHTLGGKPVFPDDDDFWASDSSLLDDVMASYSRQRLGDGELREVSRTEPWRSLWGAHKVEGSVFGVPPADYTDEQRAVVSWSLLYDSVYSHPECPPDEVLDDDDLMDGWMILQRRERERRTAEGQGERMLGSDKVRGHQEVYLVAETVDDARKVIGLNDDFSKVVQKQRFDHLKSKGVVNELDMPDTNKRLRMEVTRKLSEAVKQKHG